MVPAPNFVSGVYIPANTARSWRAAKRSPQWGTHTTPIPHAQLCQQKCRGQQNDQLTEQGNQQAVDSLTHRLEESGTHNSQGSRKKAQGNDSQSRHADFQHIRGALKIESSTSGISQKTSIPAPIKTSAITHPYLVAEFKRCFFLAPKLYPIMGIKLDSNRIPA